MPRSRMRDPEPNPQTTKQGYLHIRWHNLLYCFSMGKPNVWISGGCKAPAEQPSSESCGWAVNSALLFFLFTADFKLIVIGQLGVR